jgi:SHS2 domain-containing protein
MRPLRMGVAFMVYEVFEHTADLGLRVRASNVSQLFAEAGRGLFSLLVMDLATVRPVKECTVQLTADDREYLLFDWLNELLFLFETQHLLLSEFEVRVDQGQLNAVCRGEPVDRKLHQLDHEVKAITYHELTCRQEPSGEWSAEVIVDI